MYQVVPNSYTFLASMYRTKWHPPKPWEPRPSDTIHHICGVTMSPFMVDNMSSYTDNNPCRHICIMYISRQLWEFRDLIRHSGEHQRQLQVVSLEYIHSYLPLTTGILAHHPSDIKRSPDKVFRL